MFNNLNFNLDFMDDLVKDTRIKKTLFENYIKQTF